MRRNLRAPISTVVAILSGGLILLGYFFPLESVPFLGSLRAGLLEVAILLAAVALLMGVVNLFNVHLDKIRTGSRNALYSFFLIGSLLITLSLTIVLHPQGEIPTWLFTNIQIPAETSLMAVLAVSLAYATVRLFSRRLNVFTVIFIFTVLVVLMGSGPVFGLDIPLLSNAVRPYISQVLVGAGGRGILLGVALGSVATGLRVLLGADRPFGG